MSCPRVFLSELKTALLSLTLTLLLRLHIQADFLGIQSYRVHTIAPRPEMIAPVRLLLQMTKLVENPNRTSPCDIGNATGCVIACENGSRVTPLR